MKVSKVSIPVPMAALAIRFKSQLKSLYLWKSFSCAAPPNGAPVFILGCGRSGNTLLRSMLAAGGDMAIPPESYVFPRVFRMYKAYSFLPWPQLASLCIAEFEAHPEFETWAIDLSPAHRRARSLDTQQRSLAQIIDIIYREYIAQKVPNAKRWGEKTPINALYTRSLVSTFPEGNYIHLIRDPRAVFASYRKSGLSSSLDEVAFRWLRVEKLAARYLPRENTVHVRYEDLVKYPQMVLEKICEAIGIHFKTIMVDPWQARTELGDVEKHSHHEMVRRPVTTDSLTKWHSELSFKEINRIDELCQSYYDTHAYCFGKPIVE